MPYKILVSNALPAQELHDARVEFVSREACATFAAGLKLDRMLAMGKGYEGEEPTMHMVAERMGQRGNCGCSVQEHVSSTTQHAVMDAEGACAQLRCMPTCPSRLLCAICAEAFEAVIGAVYADAGHNLSKVCTRFLRAHSHTALLSGPAETKL